VISLVEQGSGFDLPPWIYNLLSCCVALGILGHITQGKDIVVKKSRAEHDILRIPSEDAAVVRKSVCDNFLFWIFGGAALRLLGLVWFAGDLRFVTVDVRVAPIRRPVFIGVVDALLAQDVLHQRPSPDPGSVVAGVGANVHVHCWLVGAGGEKSWRLPLGVGFGHYTSFLPGSFDRRLLSLVASVQIWSHGRSLDRESRVWRFTVAIDGRSRRSAYRGGWGCRLRCD
jgi:hypothetical protein